MNVSVIECELLIRDSLSVIYFAAIIFFIIKYGFNFLL